MLDSESQLRDAIQKMLKSPDAGASNTEPPQAPAANNNVTADHAHANASSPAAVGMDEMAMLPAEPRTLLKDLALATITGSEALASDDLATYQKQLSAMRQALTVFLTGYAHAADGPLGKFKERLPDPADLKAARRDFAYFSTAVTDLARENHLHHTEGFHVFQCPMAPGIGTGRWLQRSAELKNPFYGSAMLECGEEIK
jgi:Cu(I)/Ag(I) efflux system membrane fusion protein